MDQFDGSVAINFKHPILYMKVIWFTVKYAAMCQDNRALEMNIADELTKKTIVQIYNNGKVQRMF